MKLKKSTTFLIGFFILLILLVLLIIQNRRLNEQSSILKRRASLLKKSDLERQFSSFPEFSAVDIFGNIVNPSILKGTNVFVQFINPKLEDQIKLLKNVYFEFKNQALLMVVFTEDFQKLNEEIGYALTRMFVITDDYEKFKKIFQVPSCCENFYLFDKSGNLVVTDFNWKGYKEGIKTHLMSLVEKKKFSIYHFIELEKNIRDIDWFEQLWKIIDREKTYNYYLISMFTRVCMNCPSGWIIDSLKELYKLSNNSIYFLIILSDNFSENDVRNFKVNLGIKFSVIKADRKLANKWDHLLEEFRESDLNNIVFLIDKHGQVLSAMQSNYQEEFFNYLYNKVKTRL